MFWRTFGVFQQVHLFAHSAVCTPPKLRSAPTPDLQPPPVPSRVNASKDCMNLLLSTSYILSPGNIDNLSSCMLCLHRLPQLPAMSSYIGKVAPAMMTSHYTLLPDLVGLGNPRDVQTGNPGDCCHEIKITKGPSRTTRELQRALVIGSPAPSRQEIVDRHVKFRKCSSIASS